jgi:hypothetical protein
MHIAWGSLGLVFITSFGTAVTVVVLIAFALVGLSARTTHHNDTPTTLTPTTGTALAAACLTATTAIVLYGLYIIITA